MMNSLVMVFFYFLIPHIKIYVRVIIFLDDSYVRRHQSHLDCIIRIYISDYPGIFSHFRHVSRKYYGSILYVRF